MESVTFDKVTYIHGDCMDYMRSLPDNAFDLAVVDPPYSKAGGSVERTGGTWAAKYGTSIRNWDIAPSDEYFRELFRVSRSQIIWGGNYFNLPPLDASLFGASCQSRRISLWRWPNMRGLLLTATLKCSTALRKEIRTTLAYTLVRSRLRSTNGYWSDMPNKVIESLTRTSEAEAALSRLTASALSSSA